MALATLFVVEVIFPFKPFLMVPVVNDPFTPDSKASGQLSPSLSKSNRFGIPSLSVSVSIQLREIFNVVALADVFVLL